MTISLQPVTADNFEALIALTVAPTQRGFVADNVYSIAESKFYPTCELRGIYQNATPVGFIMWEELSYEGRPQVYNICRFMVDQQFQGAGVGRAAMELALGEIRENEDAKAIQICYVPNNPIAKTFYSTLGFTELGIGKDGEMLAEIPLGHL